MRKIILCALIMTIGFFLNNMVYGEAQKKFLLELKLNNASGEFNSVVTKNITIKIYETGASIPLWVEVHPSVRIANGLVKVLVGSISDNANIVRQLTPDLSSN